MRSVGLSAHEPHAPGKIRLAGPPPRVVLVSVKHFALACLPLVLLFAGCSSYVARVEPGTALANYQRLFVKSNFSDNHGMDGRIMTAFQERGFTVEKGPLTMMPRKTQAIVSFEDYWSWDFTTHLTNLRIYVKDAKSEALVASGTFTGPVALTTSADEAIDRLVRQIVEQKPKAKAAPRR